jgi:2,5-furandicarboxylate decarboxylase 1
LTREAGIYRALKAGGFDVTDVSLMPFLFNGVISIRKRFEGEPKNAIMAAFGAYSWLKYCIVVDEDVDVHDLADVWWALGTRSQPEKALVQVADALGFPRKDKWQIHRGKLGIDATVPMGLAAEFERKRIPGEDELDLSMYLS